MASYELEEQARKLAASDQSPDPEYCLSKSPALNYDALTSLASQISVRNIKAFARRADVPNIQAAIHKRLNTADSEVRSFYEMAQKFHIGGCKMARLICEIKGIRKPFSRIYEDSFLDDATMQEVEGGMSNQQLNQELLECLTKDAFNGYTSELLKECVGNEYEEYLIERLNQHHLVFETEADLRARGKPKTPDILFLIPVAVKPSPKFTGNSYHAPMVNWIDSKAMYADEQTFKEHFAQVQGYMNRYGHGLVIYWYGYDPAIKQSAIFQSTNDMVLLADDVPQEWILPTSSARAEAVPAPPNFE